MIGNTITIDGVSSRSFGLFCKQLPQFPVAIRDKTAYTVAGRAESLYQTLEHYADINVDVEMVAIGTNIDAAIAWMNDGKTLGFSHMHDRYAKIQQVTAITQNRVGTDAVELKVSFRCSPFKYAVNNSEIVIDPPYAFFNSVGNVYSEPLIHVVGATGDIALTVNDATVHTVGLTGDIYFDVSNRSVYQIVDNVKTIVQNKTAGEFWNLLLFPQRENFVEFANADELRITKNERWL